MFCPKCGSKLEDDIRFCPFCGEKVAVESVAAAAAPVTEAVEQVQETVAAVENQVTEAAEAVPEQVQETVTENAEAVENQVQESIADVAEAAEAQAQEKVEEVKEQAEAFEAQVQETVQQVVENPAAAPEAPVYQQPVYQQPVYQQPVYQQPVYQQPAYASNIYQQPADPVVPKKKSKAPLIITIVLLVLVLAGGGLVAYESFLADKEDRPEWLAMLDFNKGSKLPMSSSEQKTFKELVEVLDNAIIEKDSSAYKGGLPSYARDYVFGVYGLDNVKDVIKYLHDDKKYGIAQYGDDITVKEQIVSAVKIKDVEAFAKKCKSVFGKKLDITKAYVVENNSCFKGSEDSEAICETYLFYEVDGEWNIVIVSDKDYKKFGIDDVMDSDDDKKSDKSKDKDEKEDEDEE